MRKEGPGIRGYLLDAGAEGDSREVGEAADDDDDADKERDEEPAMRREGPARRRRQPLGGERAGDSEHRDDHEEPADHHREAERRVVERRVGAEPGEGAPVIPRRRGIGAEDLTEAVRAGIGEAGETRGQARREGGEAEDRKREDSKWP